MAFIPYTPIYGIPSSSFGLQMGEKDNCVGLQIYMGKKIYDLKGFGCFDPLKIDIHEVDSYVSFKLPIPNINLYNIDRTVRLLLETLKKKIAEKNGN